jgi:hydrogenase/urease accessory protein HupE
MTVPGVGNFYTGFLQPLFVPTHVTALLALGLLIAQQQRAHRRALLIIFAGGLVAALLAIVSAAAFDAARLCLLAVAAAIGLLVAIGRPLPIAATAPLAAIAGLALEFDSVPQEISMQASALRLAGTACGAFIAVMIVADRTSDPARPWLKVAMRIVGSWTAAIAILVLALHFRSQGG